MPVLNTEVAAIFREMADLLEIEGAGTFRVRAYRNAARTLSEMPRSVRDMVAQEEDLSELPGIGETLATKIRTIVTTGELPQLETLRSRVPPALAEMLRIAGLGPKRVKALYDTLHITTLADLEAAARAGQVREVPGLGPKLEEQIIQALEQRREEEPRVRLDVAEQFVLPLVAYLEADEQITRVDVAGSYRRRKETVGDLDILAISEAGGEAIGRFTAYEDVVEVVSQGETRSTVILRSGLQVDLRVVPAQHYGAALLYFTGSKAHNIALRQLALDHGLKVNEYGVFKLPEEAGVDASTEEEEAAVAAEDGEAAASAPTAGERVAGETEASVYAAVALPYIVPELREDRGEIAAAQQGTLPDLITLEAIQGDLQAHTTGSDGKATLEEMAQAARERGYAYLAITDHSPNLGVTQGLDAEALARQMAAIERLNDTFEDGFRILKGMEVDILRDGSLDLPDEVLAGLDLRVCAVHSYFDLSMEEQTERILRAMDNPYFNILAHPTGRRIGERAAYQVDIERLIAGALERGCYLELNAHPERLDLNDGQVRLAKEMGLKVAVSTDAHSAAGLDNMRYGIDQARRGWLTASDVLNTRPWPELRALLERERA